MARSSFRFVVVAAMRIAMKMLKSPVRRRSPPPTRSSHDFTATQRVTDA
jgi:hypothetical protein